MFNRLIEQFNDLRYQAQIIILICVFGLLRMLITILFDIKNQVHQAELIVDILLLFVIFSFFYVSWRKDFQNISIASGVLLSLLLAFNFLQLGGIAGYSKFNYFASIYFIIMVYGQRKMYTSIIFNLLLLLAVLIISLLSPHWLGYINFGASFQTIDFWFTLIMLSVFTIYLKELTVSQDSKLSQLNLKMAEQVRESRKLGRVLEQSNKELKHVQTKLEDEVSRRTELLQKKNQSVEEFIQLNTTELIQAVDDLLISLNQVQSSSPYATNLERSSEELTSVTDSIRTSLQKNSLLDRKVIRNYERNT
ncbi:MAG: hypothetical protein KF845_02980 [Cyclobacteriaceae bacterium]|nr:hypothetical protein [Cyclobacteriaceae bacterium]